MNNPRKYQLYVAHVEIKLAHCRHCYCTWFECCTNWISNELSSSWLKNWTNQGESKRWYRPIPNETNMYMVVLLASGMPSQRLCALLSWWPSSRFSTYQSSGLYFSATGWYSLFLQWSARSYIWSSTNMCLST